MVTTKQLKTARQVAVYALDQVLRSKAYSNISLNQVLQDVQLPDNDRRLATTIFYGVLQHKITLQYWLAPFIKDKKIDSWVNTLLLTAIYQIQYLDKVPTFAVVNESINVAKVFGHTGVRKFVTAILHRLTEQPLSDLSEIKDQNERLSIQYSVPLWLINKISTQYGETSMLAIVQSINEPANRSVRWNKKTTTQTEVIEKLKQQEIQAIPSQVSAGGLVVDQPLISNPLFNNGDITIQDESAMLAVENMQLRSTDHVLDACSAPGGKTVQIAEQLNSDEGGKVVALDIHEHKLKLVARNAKRMHVDAAVTTTKLDARKIQERFADESFDAILVDAPCSGIGLIRRKPEIRYDKTQEDSLNLQKIQLAILQAVAPKIKKGGIITYSTCTILQEENEQVVDQFLQLHQEFELQKTKTALAVKQDRQEKTLTILPSDFGSDGFFVASLVKKM
ncbi:16S rRNA (cytosine(967)-C(5))-methyltransferase RsmB [Paucilactobacillus sp. N302-9]